MARTSFVRLVAKCSVGFDVLVKRQPAHEDLPLQPVRPDLAGLDQLIGLGPSRMHVFHASRQRSSIRLDRLGLARPERMFRYLHMGSLMLLICPWRVVSLRHVRSGAFYAKGGIEGGRSDALGSLRFPDSRFQEIHRLTTWIGCRSASARAWAGAARRAAIRMPGSTPETRLSVWSTCFRRASLHHPCCVRTVNDVQAGLTDRLAHLWRA